MRRQESDVGIDWEDGLRPLPTLACARKRPLGNDCLDPTWIASPDPKLTKRQ